MYIARIREFNGQFGGGNLGLGGQIGQLEEEEPGFPSLRVVASCANVGSVEASGDERNRSLICLSGICGLTKILHLGGRD